MIFEIIRLLSEHFGHTGILDVVFKLSKMNVGRQLKQRMCIQDVNILAEGFV